MKEIVCGDAVQWAREYEGDLFHALFCDSPYHLQSIVKRYSKPDAKTEKSIKKYGTQGVSPYMRGAVGFMGQQWDGGDVAFRPETWAAFMRVLHPGAFGMTFAGSRGWHRLAVAIEDAGFVIHPSIFGWNYSTGFPKATRVGVCTCGNSKQTTKHYMRPLRVENVSKAGGDEEKQREILQPRLPEQGAQSNGKERSKKGQKGSVEQRVEGRSNVSETSRELRISEIREVPAGISTDGTQGRLHNGTPSSNGETPGATVESRGGSSPQGPQPAKQHDRKPGIISRQPNTQNNRSSETCERCGKPIAKADFLGHRYGLQALKPALEPIIVFQKPYEGRPIDNIQQTGAGVLNIDNARIPGVMDGVWGSDQSGSKHSYDGGIGGGEYKTEPHEAGRWPANFILMDEQAAAALDRQSGHLVSGQPVGIRKADNHIYGHYEPGQPITGFGDEGGASRFFFQVNEQIDSADPVHYEAKAGNEERNAGLREMPLQERTTQGRDVVRQIDRKDGRGVVPVNAQIRPRQNNHPTVKPLSLTRYLASLLLPPAEYSPRRVFVPFAGVASEMIGAMQAGWDEIVGVELTESYIPIAKARIEYWRNRGWQTELFKMEQV